MLYNECVGFFRCTRPANTVPRGGGRGGSGALRKAPGGVGAAAAERVVTPSGSTSAGARVRRARPCGRRSARGWLARRGARRWRPSGRGTVRGLATWATKAAGKTNVPVRRTPFHAAASGWQWRTGQGCGLGRTAPRGEIHAQVLGTLAEFERELIRERVRAGLDRARANGTRSGKPIGRPRRQFDVERARAMRAEGRSWRAIAQALKVPRRTVERLVGRYGPT